jgi:hypothetical protein
LVLGIPSVFCLGPITGIPAIICGHVARSRIARSGGTLGGGGTALAGLILGYLSILMVAAGIAIFARVIAKKGPQLQAGMSKGAVLAQHTRLVQALSDYKADTGQYPAATAQAGEQVDTRSLVGLLAGNNPKGKKYYEASGSGIQINGMPSDPWGETLLIAIDLDGDGKVKLGDTEVPGICAVWSSGPNELDEQGGGDDVTSW